MKSLIRNIVINSLSLFILALAIPGFRVSGGVLTYLLGGIALSILFMIVKPILNIISLPLNLVTLGLFSFVTNAIIFYLLTVFVTPITITAFTFPGVSSAGFIIPKLYINTLFAFILIAFFQSLIVTFASWIIKK